MLEGDANSILSAVSTYRFLERKVNHVEGRVSTIDQPKVYAFDEQLFFNIAVGRFLIQVHLWSMLETRIITH